MGYVISYESLRDIYEQMSSVIEKTSNERIPKIRAALDEFINEDSMQGETADTIKEYLTYTHMVILQGICEVCSQFLVKFRLYQDGYYNIDSHENALLDEGAINFVDDLVKDFVRKESNLTDSFKLEARAISDIFSEPVPSDDNIRDISDIIKRRNENLHNAVINHERSHKNALSDVEELIISLKATIDSCKKSIGNFTIPLDNLKVVVENMKEIEEFQINSASEIEDAFYRQEAIVKEIFLEKQAEEREERGFWKCVAGTVTIVTGGVAIVVSGGVATPIVLGAATVAFGTSDVVEGSQDIHYGSIKDITSKSFNPLRDTVFAENQRLYDMTESVVTFASGASIPLSGSKALTFSSKARIVGTEAVKEFTGIAGGFVGEDLGENLGFSKEQSMMLGILASIASAKGVDSLHKNYSSIKAGKISTVDDVVRSSKSGSNTNKLFKNQALLDEHYGKHGQEIADVLGDSNYSIDKYLDDANYIINNGTYVPELNGYVSFMSGKKYGFVGLDRTTGDITTFHIKNISELIKKATSLGFER